MPYDTKPAWEIEQRIIELDGLLEKMKQGAGADFASQLGYDSLANYRRQLKEELHPEVPETFEMPTAPTVRVRAKVRNVEPAPFVFVDELADTDVDSPAVRTPSFSE